MTTTIEALIRLSKYENWRIRVATATALGQVGSASPAMAPRATNALKALSNDSDGYLRTVVEDALQKIVVT
jgi:HEAT repeat protein